MAVRKRSKSAATISSRLEVLADTIAEQHVDVIQRLTRLETQFDGLPTRVSALEQVKYKASGALKSWQHALITGGISTAVSFLIAWIRK